MGLLTLVPIYFGERQELLPAVTRRIESAFGLTVRTRPPWFDPERAFDSARGQYNSTILLKMLLTRPEGESERILGLAGVDLFIPVLTYVFGEAQLSGRAAVASVHRLQNELYGLPQDDRLTLERLEKEVVHELGHTFGLAHCRSSECVMVSSTYVEEIDFKTVEICERCSLQIATGRRGS